MAWGQEKGADVKISALPVSMRFFDFVPCSLPLKTLILLTFSCFLIRRRGKGFLFFRVGRGRRAETPAVGDNALYNCGRILQIVSFFYIAGKGKPCWKPPFPVATMSPPMSTSPQRYRFACTPASTPG